MIPAFFMAEAAHVRGITIPQPESRPAPRHSAVIRITHWITTASFLCLVISGIAILLAHPRLYWGEIGVRGGPSLINLPLPFVLDVPIRGPGRYLHFLSAWISLFTGMIYVVVEPHHHSGRNLLPRGLTSVGNRFVLSFWITYASGDPQQKRH